MSDVLDEALEIIAQVVVSGETDSELLNAFGMGGAAAPARYVLLAGVRALKSAKGHDNRLRLKVLELNPQHFEDMRRRAEERQAIQLKKPAYQAYLRKREAKEVERLARNDENMAHFRAAMDKVGVALRLYDEWKLSTGKTLGEATKADLLAEASTNQATAEGLLRNCDFYTRLSEKVPEGKTVAESVGLEEAHQIRQAVYLPAAA